MTNIATITTAEKYKTRHFTSSHIAYFDQTGRYRIFPAKDRMLRTFADCIYVHGIISVNGERYIRTGDTKYMAHKGRKYRGYPTILLDMVLDTLYSRVEDYADQERYHLYTVNEYETGAEPRFTDIQEYEVSIR